MGEGQYNVFIVDDRPVLRRVLVDWLQVEFPYCRFEAFRDAESMLETVQEHPPDLVLMDVSLPGMNGIEAMRVLRTSNPALPVVILSIHCGKEYRERALAEGAVLFICKDKAHNELPAALRELLPEKEER
ncbi:MAG: response regulator transcription factor [Bacteroidota bacterium]|nr:response regulator transcription factor [Bacteroidota bacterium]